MTKELAERITRLEEQTKQTTKDITEIKELLKEHTASETASMKSLGDSIAELQSSLGAVKFGWKVLATVGAIGLTITGFVLEYIGVFTHG